MISKEQEKLFVAHRVLGSSVLEASKQAKINYKTGLRVGRKPHILEAIARGGEEPEELDFSPPTKETVYREIKGIQRRIRASGKDSATDGKLMELILRMFALVPKEIPVEEKLSLTKAIEDARARSAARTQALPVPPKSPVVEEEPTPKEPKPLSQMSLEIRQANLVDPPMKPRPVNPADRHTFGPPKERPAPPDPMTKQIPPDPNWNPRQAAFDAGARALRGDARRRRDRGDH